MRFKVSIIALIKKENERLSQKTIYVNMSVILDGRHNLRLPILWGARGGIVMNSVNFLQRIWNNMKISRFRMESQISLAVGFLAVKSVFNWIASCTVCIWLPFRFPIVSAPCEFLAGAPRNVSSCRLPVWCCEICWQFDVDQWITNPFIQA